MVAFGRLRLAALLLLAGCASSHRSPAASWVEFTQTSMTNGSSLTGDITRAGVVHFKARRRMSWFPAAFEKQLVPSEIGRIRLAIAKHVERYGRDAAVRPGMTDRLVGGCEQEDERRQYELWNEIMHAIRTPEYDTLDHVVPSGT